MVIRYDGQKFHSSTVQADISDHHSFIYTMLSPTFYKDPAKFINYRSYNSYNKEGFGNVLK